MLSRHFALNQKLSKQLDPQCKNTTESREEMLLQMCSVPPSDPAENAAWAKSIRTRANAYCDKILTKEAKAKLELISPRYTVANMISDLQSKAPQYPGFA